MVKLFIINENDNVAVALEEIEKGHSEKGITALDNIPFGHKIALCDINKGENVIKYGNPIGHAKNDIKKGSHIHSHNLATNLSSTLNYEFENYNEYRPERSDLKINAYKRENGKIGIRNEIWIIPTVGCVNKTCEKLANRANQILKSERSDPKLGTFFDGVFAYTHPFGCSQLDEDLENTQKVLAALVNHPNCGGALVVSLGCENNNLKEFKPFLGDYDSSRINFLVTQNAGDELEEGLKLIEEIYNELKKDIREEVGIENLVVGYKCGGSDAFSGITANALCGRVNEKLTNVGAATILTEVPEMFGAEHILMKRSKNREVFDKIVNMINGFKEYYFSHGKECYENPSPGNKEGGITTLEEKSLGCIQKGGNSIITDVLSYGEQCKTKGLNLLTGVGNDIVSTTNLTAAGAHIILFTTGRGTSLGAPVPTIKISSNSALAKRKPNWIDFNAGELIENPDFEKMSDELLKLIILTANGKPTKNEINEIRDISIFKDGVIL
ncbi:MAG: altronate dehydratase [Eubacterium sp.]|nr:altronate dehydratase [Eubacterium sp.]